MQRLHMLHRPSPNFNARPPGGVDVLVLHYTGMPSAEEALARLADPESGVSAHYLVDEDGAAYALVAEEMRAWHAGVSHWRGRDNVNDFSIGVEIVNPGHEFGYRPFPAPQMEAVAALCRGILSRHPILPRDVVAHSDIAPARKRDPGELFNWAWLAGQGVGLWPANVPPAPAGLLPPTQGARGEAVSRLQSRLRLYGYAIQEEGVFGDETRLVAKAFQRHFRASAVSGAWDAECEALLAALLAMV